MDVNVKVTVELGPQTLALLTNGIIAQPAKKATEEKVEAVEEVAETEKPKTTRTRATSKKAEPKQDAPAFEDLDEDAQLEAIKAEVTKHTKKGKSADIKALLSGFDAGRASELDPATYGDFMDAVKRYGAGESVDDIIGLD